jgi:hypothetical protein
VLVDWVPLEGNIFVLIANISLKSKSNRIWDVGEMSKFRIFAEKPLDKYYLNLKKEEIKTFFKQKSEEELIEIKDNYITQLMDEYKIIIPQLDYENIHNEVEEVDDVDIYVFKIPFTSNNIEYFELEPSTGLMWSYQVYIEDQELCFDIVDDNFTVEEMKMKYKNIVDKIKERSDNVNKLIKSYNKDLEKFIESEYNNRNNRLLNRKKKSDALGLSKD